MASVTTGVIGIVNPTAGFALAGVNITMSILDYADAHNYDVKEIKNDLTKQFQDSWNELKNKLQEIKNNLFSDTSDIQGISEKLAASNTFFASDGDLPSNSLSDKISIWNNELSSKYGNDASLYTDTESGTQFIANSNGDILAILSKSNGTVSVIDANDYSSINMSASGVVSITTLLTESNPNQITIDTQSNQSTPNPTNLSDIQFTTALGMEGPLNLTPINLGNTTLFIDSNNKVVGELTTIEGDTNGIAKYTDSEGNTTYITNKGQTLTPEQYTEYQWGQAAGALGLTNSIIGLQNFSNETNLQKITTIASIYNQIDHLGSGGVVGSDNLPGELGGVVAGLGLVNALQSGNTAGIMTNGLMFANAVSQGAVNAHYLETMGSEGKEAADDEVFLYCA